MFLVLLVLLVPINLVGLLALVASFRSQKPTVLIGLAIPSLLAAATGLVLGFFGVAEMDRASKQSIAETSGERREAIIHTRDESSNIFVATGVAGTLIPWFGGILALRRARRIDD